MARNVLLLMTMAAIAPVVRLHGQVTPKPTLPVIDFDACGSPNSRIYSGAPRSFGLEADDRLYSSWEENRTLIRNIPRGSQVERIGAVNITREPARGVMTGTLDQSLRPLATGDEVLGYGLHSDSRISFWGKGISFTESYENVAYKGSCGFADQTQCHINLTNFGKQEWWMQLKTSDGVTGWILGLTQNGDEISYRPNAGYACRD